MSVETRTVSRDVRLFIAFYQVSGSAHFNLFIWLFQFCFCCSLPKIKAVSIFPAGEMMSFR